MTHNHSLLLSIRPWKRNLMSCALVGVLLCGVACGQQTKSTNQSNRVVFSSKEFDRGRQDGKREAKTSWSDDSGAWTWIWMMSEDYGKGYDQGWTEGRAEVRSKKMHEQNQQNRRPSEKAPTEESWNP